MVMGKTCLPSTHCLALVLWFVAACGNSQAQAPKTATSQTRGSHEAVSWQCHSASLTVAHHVCALWNMNKNSAKVKQPNA
jgi:hypothetical protein